MTEDVESTLASLEQRLRALQAELDDEGAPPDPLPPPPPRPLERVLSAQHERVTDPLERFGAELRRLVELWDDTVAELRGEAIPFSGLVALEARADLQQLSELDRALRALPGVVSVVLRAYAAGHAALDLELAEELPLIAALRRSLSFSVEDARPGRLAIALAG